MASEIIGVSSEIPGVSSEIPRVSSEIPGVHARNPRFMSTLLTKCSVLAVRPGLHFASIERTLPKKAPSAATVFFVCGISLSL